ncbi:uncharacterized protein TM35_000083360 [Trypanosoma theileri]|uniref:Uncharacterized protein n=1 Tax=Trypanosoma theileri TaxID=67003 RepID=A0A1X0P130_9TRYP|nr:uncharacterized protein TM35_000083360 [Trypanosoma theileri]ORC90538.1 hypothetical protein TM35_000083360 [Trypanosoma theileri]
MRFSSLRRLQWGPAALNGTAVAPRRKRQFVMREGNNRATPQHHSRNNNNNNNNNNGTVTSPPAGVARGLSQREHYRALREAHQQQQQQQQGEEEGNKNNNNNNNNNNSGKSVPGEWLAPLPRRPAPIDADGYDAAPPTADERRAWLQAALERNAASVVEFTPGGEKDIDTGGRTPADFHANASCTTIPTDSVLYNAVLAGAELDSRRRNNSWTVARKRQQGVCEFAATSSVEGKTTVEKDTAKSDNDNNDENGSGNLEHVIDERRRRQREDEGSYTDVFEGDLLEPNYESIGYSRSTYGMRKLFLSGLTGYQGMITREEEARICDELLHLLQDRRAAYVAEETRYCVNLYEKELGIPGKDTLAFAMNRAPTLQLVLARFFHLGLIPSPPNVCQVSEMIGNFSGYPVHKKPPTIGPYVGILNLVSTTVMHFQHLNCPWFPRIHMNPRSLFIVEQPCLGEYKMGYKRTEQPFHAFEYATRVSKDYRIEVLFATVEVEQTRYLRDAVGLTEYAEKREQEKMGKEQLALPKMPQSSSIETGDEVSLFSGSTDKWLERLNNQLHASEEVTGNTPKKGTMIDGNALREKLLASGCIGTKSRPLETSSLSSLDGETPDSNTEEKNTQPSEKMSPAQRRMAALKARYAFAKRLKEETRPQVSSGGVHLIQGHSPRKQTRL